MSEVNSAPRYVLVVEDEPIIRMNAVDMLEEAGFEVLEAVNADAVLRLLKAKAHKAHEIAALFTDIHMPGSMNGMALATLVPSVGLTSGPSSRPATRCSGTPRSLTMTASWPSPTDRRSSRPSSEMHSGEHRPTSSIVLIDPTRRMPTRHSSSVVC